MKKIIAAATIDLGSEWNRMIEESDAEWESEKKADAEAARLAAIYGWVK